MKGFKCERCKVWFSGDVCEMTVKDPRTASATEAPLDLCFMCCDAVTEEIRTYQRAIPA